MGSDTLWLIYPYAHFRHLIAESTLFPLWNPYVFAGTPFLAESSNTQLLQPLHVLFAILPPGTAIAATMPLHLLLAGISMYAYLRVIDLPRGSALIGAITFMLASVATWWLLLSYIQASVVWLLPMALVGIEITLRGQRLPLGSACDCQRDRAGIAREYASGLLHFAGNWPLCGVDAGSTLEAKRAEQKVAAWFNLEFSAARFSLPSQRTDSLANAIVPSRSY